MGVGRAGRYLAEEREDALVLLKELGDGEAAALDAPQRVEEQVAVEGALALLGPHVDLLLMVGEGAVIPVLTVLLVNHVCKEATGHTFCQAGRRPPAPPGLQLRPGGASNSLAGLGLISDTWAVPCPARGLGRGGLLFALHLGGWGWGVTSSSAKHGYHQAPPRV